MASRHADARGRDASRHLMPPTRNGTPEIHTLDIGVANWCIASHTSGRISSPARGMKVLGPHHDVVGIVDAGTVTRCSFSTHSSGVPRGQKCSVRWSVRPRSSTNRRLTGFSPMPMCTSESSSATSRLIGSSHSSGTCLPSKVNYRLSLSARQGFHGLPAHLSIRNSMPSDIQHGYPIREYDSYDAALDAAEAFVGYLTHRLTEGSISSADSNPIVIRGAIQDISGNGLFPSIQRLIRQIRW